MTHENGNASADRPPFFSGLHRHLPLIDILEFPRHHRELGAGDSRDLTDHLVDEAQKLLGVARVYLNTEVAFTDGPGQIAHRRKLDQLRRHVLQLAGGDVDEDVADDGETHRLNTEVAFTDGPGQIAHRRKLDQLRRHVLQLAGGDVDEDVADDGETHRLRIDDGADADHARAHQPLDAVAHGALGHVSDTSRYLGRRDAAVLEKK